MIQQFVEVTNAEGGGGLNWGKFLVCEWEPSDWTEPAAIEGALAPLLREVGTRQDDLWVLDLQTGRGSRWHPALGSLKADLEKADRERLWVCPMYEAFIHWLYDRRIARAADIPRIIHLTEKEAPSALAGKWAPG